jgi:ring-1,2-phenylacetyl-CoA epoxidase subunit PaaB
LRRGIVGDRPGGRSQEECKRVVGARPSVFIRAKSGLSHRHAGSVHAADDEMALNHARDVYTRRNEGVSIWVVKSSEIVASDPEESAALFEPAKDKIYRHPTFYEIPDGVENL